MHVDGFSLPMSPAGVRGPDLWPIEWSVRVQRGRGRSHLQQVRAGLPSESLSDSAVRQ